MVNIYLFIELLRAANPTEIVDTLKGVDLTNCKFANVVVLSKQKIVAQLDCNSYDNASKAVLERISPVEGIVQTNIVAAVRPVRR
ncbi:MAG: hypothetical protein KAI41_05580 [Hyphomicrobiaceae bacterium]|jgi:hypothetical protein|nr:hypothetical protein [Hyphomicrobiaceae bacterium]